MKKAITILTICLLAFAGMQNAQAQTKEETIEWIKEKLEKYYYYKGDIDEITVEPCLTKWKHYSSRADDVYWTFSFNPSLGGNWSSYENSGGTPGYWVKAEASIIKVYYSYHNSYSDSKAFIISDGEPHLAERMAKALNHLATFCEKKKEAF